jgi:hypothetical protein
MQGRTGSLAIVIPLLLTPMAACLAQSGGPGGSTADGSPGSAADGSQRDAEDARPDGVGDAQGPFPCGQSMCTPAQYCLHPCCQDPNPLPCTPLPDGGACPPGTHQDASCFPRIDGCRNNPCTPPPESCVDKIVDHSTCPSASQIERDIVCSCS